MTYQNRIIGHGEEVLDQILFNPLNWRIHPKAQQDALDGVLSEVGWVQDVIVNKRTGRLVDGHLRCQLAARKGDKTIPVTYVDLDEQEEALVKTLYSAGITEIFLQGRAKTSRATNAYSCIDREIELLSSHYRLIEQDGQVAYMVR